MAQCYFPLPTDRPPKKCMLQIGETKVVGDLRRQTLSDFKIGRVHFWRHQTSSKKLTPIDPCHQYSTTTKPVMSTIQQAIDARGTLENMLNEGFSDFASISEKIDNPLDAGATQMKIYCDSATHTMIFADNGRGMNEEQAKEAHRINSRKERSSSKHGRFGRGGAQSTVHLTNLKTKTTCISRTREKALTGADPMDVSIDWKKCVELNNYNPQPHEEAGGTSMRIWNQYAIDPRGYGTVFHIMCAKARFDSIIEAFRSANVVENLKFWLGRTYYNPLNAGFELSFIIDGVEHKVDRIDPLYPSYNNVAHRNCEQIEVYSMLGGDDVRAYYKENEKLGYMDFTKRGKFVEGTPVEGARKIGDIAINSLYLPRELLATAVSGIDSDQMSSQELRKYLYGIYYERNGKIVSRNNVAPKDSGDKDKYKYWEEVCHCIAFNAAMDDYFDIQVNKSRIDVGNFNKNIAGTIRRITGNFSNRIAKIAAPAPVVAQPAPVVAKPAPVVAQPAPVVAQPAPVVAQPAPVVAQPAPVVAQPAPVAIQPSSKVTLAQAKQPMSTNTPFPASSPASSPASTPASTPASSQTHTQIPAHTRLTSKSEYDDWLEIAKLKADLMKIDIDAKLASASTETRPNLVDYYKSSIMVQQFIANF